MRDVKGQLDAGREYLPHNEQYDMTSHGHMRHQVHEPKNQPASRAPMKDYN